MLAVVIFFARQLGVVGEALTPRVIFCESLRRIIVKKILGGEGCLENLGGVEGSVAVGAQSSSLELAGKQAVTA